MALVPSILEINYGGGGRRPWGLVGADLRVAPSVDTGTPVSTRIFACPDLLNFLGLVHIRFPQANFGENQPVRLSVDAGSNLRRARCDENSFAVATRCKVVCACSLRRRGFSFQKDYPTFANKTFVEPRVCVRFAPHPRHVPRRRIDKEI